MHRLHIRPQPRILRLGILPNLRLRHIIRHGLHILIHRNQRHIRPQRSIIHHRQRRIRPQPLILQRFQRHSRLRAQHGIVQLQCFQHRSQRHTRPQLHGLHISIHHRLHLDQLAIQLQRHTQRIGILV